MNFSVLANALRLHLRAELLVAEIRLRLHLRKTALELVAGFVGLLGLVFVNVALYQALLTSWGPVLTPLALGGINIVLALILLIIAAVARPGAELAAAEELRRLTAATLEADLKAGPALSLGGLLGGGGADLAAGRLIIPVVGMIVEALRRRKKSAAE